MIADLRAGARQRLPRLFFDYIDGGSHSETTARHNELDFGRWRLIQRVLRGVGQVDLGCTYMGVRNALPFMLGPVGYLGMLARHGDIAASRAAREAGIAACISTFSIASLEEIAAASGGCGAYQLYMFRDRGVCLDMLTRVEAAGMSSLIVTVDTPITPMRPRDARNGFRAMTRLSMAHLLDMARHPAWACDLLRGGRIEVSNVARYDMGSGILEQSGRVAAAIDPRLSWHDLAWLRRNWGGRLYVKGILAPDDARECREQGADGVIVSSHGGRQLDLAPSSISCLPGVRSAVGDTFEILFDSGIRRGSDIVMALALGADAVALGRAYAWGLAAFGEAGVATAIRILAGEISSTLALMGLSSIDQLKATPRGELLEACAIG